MRRFLLLVLRIRNGAYDCSRSTGSRNNNVYNINYHQDRTDYSNEGHAATPAQLLFDDPVDSSNPRICICDTPSFPINCANGCNNDNNSRYVKHTLVTYNSVNCEKVSHFGCIANLLHDANAINNDHTYYICLECESKYSESVPWNDLTPQQSEENFARFGICYSEDDNALMTTAKQKEMKHMECTMRKSLRDSDFSLSWTIRHILIHAICG
mmetsp:Transcript_7553/g.9624  ORF Transcript_7553/g.9624 Transcript_7553/m.9624 type:complete len:212 (+) Transcript_7553:452-1087(+)